MTPKKSTMESPSVKRSLSRQKTKKLRKDRDWPNNIIIIGRTKSDKIYENCKTPRIKFRAFGFIFVYLYSVFSQLV